MVKYDTWNWLCCHKMLCTFQEKKNILKWIITIQIPIKCKLLLNSVIICTLVLKYYDYSYNEPSSDLFIIQYYTLMFLIEWFDFDKCIFFFLLIWRFLQGTFDIVFKNYISISYNKSLNVTNFHSFFKCFIAFDLNLVIENQSDIPLSRLHQSWVQDLK